MWWFVVTFAIGLAVGRRKLIPAALLHNTGRIITPSLLALILILGYEIGASKSVVAQLPTIGAEALVICVLSMAGSAMFGFVTWKLTSRTNFVASTSSKQIAKVSHRLTFILLIAVVCGIFTGWVVHGRIDIPAPLDNLLFSLLLFGVGLEVGREEALILRIRHAGWSVLLLPACVVFGTLLGSMIASMCLGMSTHLSLAIGAGYGWYSLAAVLLGHLQSASAGALAFLANVLRELLSFVMIPLISRKLGGYAAIAISGATSMDTTLPVIVRASGASLAIPSFLSGLIVSLCVPIAIPLLFNM